MKSRFFFVILLILGVAIVIGLTNNAKSSDNSNQTTAQNTNQPQSPGALQSISKSMGAVEVEVVPLTISGEEIVFKLILNTHSVDLNYDFTQIITLTDNQGKTYRALDWAGEAGGHHLEGSITFEPLDQNLQSITLNINGIDNQSSDFTWDLKGGDF